MFYWINFFAFLFVYDVIKRAFRPCETYEAIISLRGALHEFNKDPDVERICDLGDQDSKILSSKEYSDLVNYINSKKHLHWVGRGGVYTDAWGKEFTIQVTKESDGLKFIINCNSKLYNSLFEKRKSLEVLQGKP